MYLQVRRVNMVAKQKLLFYLVPWSCSDIPHAAARPPLKFSILLKDSKTTGQDGATRIVAYRAYFGIEVSSVMFCPVIRGPH